MSMLHECAREGCEVLTMGEFCVNHEGADSSELTAALTAAAAAAAEEANDTDA